MTPNQIQWVTVGFLIFVALELVAYDALVWRCWGVEATISRVCLSLSRRWPLLYALSLFALGLLLGHLFLPQPEPRPGQGSW